MLTLKYQPTQRGPVYQFVVESSANFLSRDLALIAYSSSEKGIPNNFTHITAQSLSFLRYVQGNIQGTSSKLGLTTAANFDDSQMKLIRDQDITITLLRNSQSEQSGFWAVGHFQARVNHTDVAICSPDGKGAITDIQECKFDTLTFEPLGSIVRFPGKRSGKRNYENVEEAEHDFAKEESHNIHMLTPPANQIRDWSELEAPQDYKRFQDPVRLDQHFSGAFDISTTLESCSVEEYEFPKDVFETDMVFVDLPTKK
eukprot:gene12235-14168_t